MPEINVQPEKVTPVLSNLKTKTQELETTNPNPSFSTSSLDFLEKMQAIEKKYYQALNDYKQALTKVETNVDESIQAYVETDENIANQIGPLPVK
ncbi:YwqI/YxiC family protein [Lentibacillus sp. N15]|uniref:YwqI/YxiC family protein n=1 Tax=Lentibacillus songyuanensis TaxID=3136161 RepID=UPI0031B9F33E